MKQYGYARVSTKRQNIERQIRNIISYYPKAIVFQDKYTGRKMARPDWDRLLKLVREGDTIIFDSVSRMARNAEEGFQVYEELYNKNIELVFIKEPHVNTETYKKALQNSVQLTGTAVDYILEGVNKYLLALAKEQIQLAFEQAEKEVTDLRQRTREGIETARIHGKQIGGVKGKKLTTKKELEAKKIIRNHSRDFGGALTDSECQKLAGISRNSFYKYKGEMKEEGC